MGGRAPGCIMLNLEDGLNNIDCQRTEHLTTLDGVIEALDWLISSKHDFFTLAIDSMDWLEALIHSEVARAANVAQINDIDYARGYTRALSFWDKILLRLEMLRSDRRMSIVLIAHSEIKAINIPGENAFDRYQPAIHKLASAMFQEWVDEVFFGSIRTFTRTEKQGFGKERTITVDGNERYIRTQETAAVLAKNRLGMPPEIEFTWEAYQTHFPV